MSSLWEMAWEESALARRFVDRLGQVPPHLLQPEVPPVLDRDPYLSAWTNLQVALGAAPATDRQRIADLTTELDKRIEALRLSPVMAEAARRATRALLAQRWLLTPESFTFVYQPFESVVPLGSLRS